MKAELLKLIADKLNLVIDENSTGIDYINEFLSGELNPMNAAWQLIDHYGLPRRGNRSVLFELLNEFSHKHNIKFTKN